MATCLGCGAWLDEDPHFENCPMVDSVPQNTKNKFVFFGELKIGQKFNFILWQQGLVEFQKTDINIGVRNSTQEPHKFHFNDLVEIVGKEQDEIKKRYFISIKQGGVLIANKVMCECSNKDIFRVALELKNEIAASWNISSDSCTFAVFETLESYIPLYRSFSWKD